MRSPSVVFLLVALVPVVATACDSPCTREASAPGLSVAVTDGAGGRRICDATVALRRAGYYQMLAPATFRDEGGVVLDCIYVGSVERPGRYDVVVARASRMKTLPDFEIKEDRCPMPTVDLTVALDP